MMVILKIFVALVVIGAIINIFNWLFSETEESSASTDVLIEAELFLELFAKVAEANGSINDDEERYIWEKFDEIYPEKYEHAKGGDKHAKAVLMALCKNKLDDREYREISEIASDYLKKANLNQDERIGAVIMLLNLAYLDDECDIHEKREIEKVCKVFGIYGEISNQIFAKFEREFGAENDDFTDSCENEIYLKKGAFDAKNQEKDPYEILGVSKEANFDEIKKAYKAITMKFAYQAAANSAKSSLPTDN